MPGPEGSSGSSGAGGASNAVSDSLSQSRSADTSKVMSSGVGKATPAAGTTTTTTPGSAQKATYPNLSMMKKKAVTSSPDQPSYVSEPMIEFLIAEILHYAESSCPPEDKSEEQAIFACEMSAAKLERIGYSVGYRLCERLAQNRTFGGAAPSQAGAKNQQAGAGAGTNNSAQALATQQQQAKIETANAVAASQLEAVKFLCKEFWMEVFRKQIDKLQTNHRGVFVLKDLELSWLTRFPNNQEAARVTAIQLLAYPCGMLRGALANLGIPAVVSCDFLTDGQNMASCSFNVKIK